MAFSLSGMMMTSGDFTLTGFSSDTAIANAANGTFAMSSGEVFGYGESDNGKVIISKALADFNDLKVGDEITVTNPSDTSTTYTFTIGGIYKNSTSSNTSAMGPMGGTSQDADNAIYTSVSTLKSLGLDADTTANDDDNNTTTQLGYTYVLGSADDYETFAPTSGRPDWTTPAPCSPPTWRTTNRASCRSTASPSSPLRCSSSYWRSVRSCSICSTSANANTRLAYSPSSA